MPSDNRFSLPSLFGKYSLPNVLGRLFHRGPGDVSRQTFPVSPSFNVGNIPVGGGQLFSPNYGGDGWMGPQPGDDTFGGFNPILGVGDGLDAAQGGQDYGAFTPNFGAYGGGPMSQGGGYGSSRDTNSAGFSGGSIPLSEYSQFAQNNAGESAARNLMYQYRKRS